MQNIDSLPEDSFLRNEIVLDIINNVLVKMNLTNITDPLIITIE